MTLLELKNISVSYGRIEAIHDMSFSVEEGEIVSLIGANGAGKSTTMKTISGILNPSKGSILFDGEDITKMKAHIRVVRGISQAPEGRGIFPGMTVMENLDMGAFGRKDRSTMGEDFDRVFALFPRLAERKSQLAGSMSGGEQQMVALGRALMTAPKILLVDEPSVGLAPILVSRTIDKIKELKDSYQLTVLMAEQNFNQAIRIADRGYVIVHGKIAYSGDSAADLNNNDLIKKFYLGL